MTAMFVGVVGVGRIGAVLVARLVDAGHTVLATDIRSERRYEVDKVGAEWVSDAAEVAVRSNVVLTALPGTPELHDLLFGSKRLLPHLVDAVWVDLTSASFEFGEECARRTRELGIAYLDAPIGGGVSAVRDARATLYVGGDAEVLATTATVLRSFAETIHHVGGAGLGYLCKLLVNLLWFGHVALTTEALLLAQRHGGSPDRMRELLQGSAGDNAFVGQHLPALLDGDFLTDFGLDRCVEELNAIERSAVRAGTPHPVMSVVAELHRSALRRYGAVNGELMAAAWLEEQTGSRLRREQH